MTHKKMYRKDNKCFYINKSNESCVPPWCSLGREPEWMKPRKVSRSCMRSVCLAKNTCVCLNAETVRKSDLEEKSEKIYKNRNRIKRFKSGVKLLVLLLLALGIISYFAPNNILQTDQLTSILSKTNFISFLGSNTRVEEECHRTRQLALALNRAEQALRAIRRQNTKSILQIINTEGASAVKGNETLEWDRNIVFWGFVPYWRYAPPPETVLKLLPPTPTDCWPFRGSYGELIIQLAKLIRVDRISVEHISPDIGSSAPKQFIVFGILANGTWLKAADRVYRHNKFAKQYFHLDNSNVPFQQIVFRVLSNHGNPKYTCLYRIHLYTIKYIRPL